jgi:hypothetical protein
MGFSLTDFSVVAIIYESLSRPNALGNALQAGPVITGIYRRGGAAIYEEGGIQ